MIHVLLVAVHLSKAVVVVVDIVDAVDANVVVDVFVVGGCGRARGHSGAGSEFNDASPQFEFTAGFFFIVVVVRDTQHGLLSLVGLRCQGSSVFVRGGDGVAPSHSHHHLEHLQRPGAGVLFAEFEKPRPNVHEVVEQPLHGLKNGVETNEGKIRFLDNLLDQPVDGGKEKGHVKGPHIPHGLGSHSTGFGPAPYRA